MKNKTQGHYCIQVSIYSKLIVPHTKTIQFNRIEGAYGKMFEMTVRQFRLGGNMIFLSAI